MENSSKALIIAAAILIAILLITIGIILINSERDIVNTGATAMSSQAIQAFNAQFTPYEGTNKSTSDAIKIVDAVIASNASHSNQVVIYLDDIPAYVPNGNGLYYGGGSTSSFSYSDDNNVFHSITHSVFSFSEIKTDLIKYNEKINISLYYCNNSKRILKSSYNSGLNLIPRLHYAC